MNNQQLNHQSCKLPQNTREKTEVYLNKYPEKAFQLAVILAEEIDQLHSLLRQNLQEDRQLFAYILDSLKNS